MIQKGRAPWCCWESRLRRAAFFVVVGVSVLGRLSFADIIIDLTYIGFPGNPEDEPPGKNYKVGRVDYPYYIGT